MQHGDPLIEMQEPARPQVRSFWNRGGSTVASGMLAPLFENKPNQWANVRSTSGWGSALLPQARDLGPIRC
jgi:hypothetical protein